MTQKEVKQLAARNRRAANHRALASATADARTYRDRTHRLIPWPDLLEAEAMAARAEYRVARITRAIALDRR